MQSARHFVDHFLSRIIHPLPTWENVSQFGSDLAVRIISEQHVTCRIVIVCSLLRLISKLWIKNNTPQRCCVASSDVNTFIRHAIGYKMRSRNDSIILQYLKLLVNNC